ncbi:MAG: DUF1207 domain-containing protein [Pirellulaceae bacterium]
MFRDRKVRAAILVLVGLFGVSATVGRGEFTDPPPPSIEQVESETLIPGPVEQPYFDLDAYLDGDEVMPLWTSEWHWQLLPNDLIYKSYLGGVKEPRSGTTMTNIENDGWVWDGILGARLGLIRFGDHDLRLPQGFQIDVEGAANVRLDVEQDVDVRATDYRVGVPFTYGRGIQQWKFAYYHTSSHLGDEFVIRNVGYPRLNWSRDAIVLGYSIYMTETLRLYAEAGWAFHSEISEPWEFQFGVDWAPTAPTGFRGAPFFAVNGHLRQEVEFGGNVTVVTGWSWMSDRDRHLLRLGAQYYNGRSSQYSFYDAFEETLGLGMWYDF